VNATQARAAATNAMGKLEGKVVLFTGGPTGVGLAAQKQSVNEDAYVFRTGRSDPKLVAPV